MKIDFSSIILFITITFGTSVVIKRSPTLSKHTNILEITKLKNRYYSSKTKYDLVIVGAGLAGLTASYEANKLFKGKKKILVLEKNPNTGGNSAKATSGINILNTPLQKEQNVVDSFELFYNDTMKSGKYLSVPELVSTVVKDSHYLYDFYKNEVNADLSKLGILGGHSVARTVRPTTEVIGSHLVTTVFNVLEKLPKIEFIYNATAIELLTNKKNTYITGIKYIINDDKSNVIEVSTKAVILTTGGFGYDFDSDDSLLKEFVPKLMKYPTTNGASTQGIGIKMGRKIGIGLIGMDQVQVHPTGFVLLSDRFNKNKWLAPELLRGVGGILVNQTGERFCNELGTRDYVTKQITENCKLADSDNITQYESYLIINQKAFDDYGGKIGYYIITGHLKEFNNSKEFTDMFNISYDNLNKTLIKYNESADNGKDEFGKTTFNVKFDLNEKIYVGVITPSIHYTMGGLSMTKNGELKKNDGTIMKGLYGAGEVTGGVHGGNRLGGNSLMECGVYGRRAARVAVKYVSTFGY